MCESRMNTDSNVVNSLNNGKSETSRTVRKLTKKRMCSVKFNEDAVTCAL